ncbi:MAG: cohesin domain-containing protein [Bacteroidota bacterium]|nr:cohesin domain-containing protein [Bacteroidota bacterium]
MRKALHTTTMVLLFACSVSARTEPRPRVSFSPKEQTVNIGDRIAVTIRVESVQTLRTYGIRIRYDTAVLQCTDVCASGFFRGYQTFFYRDINPVKEMAGADESILGSGHCRGDGDLFTLVFIGRRYGTANLGFVSVVLYDSSQTPIEAETDDGAIVVHVDEINPPAMEPGVSLEPSYPSPAGERVFLPVRSRTTTTITLSVYDNTGSLVEIVYEGVIEPGRKEFSLPLVPVGRGRFRNGVYYAVLRGQGVYTVTPFTVLR